MARMYTEQQVRKEKQDERERAAKKCEYLASLIENNGEAHGIQIEALTDAADCIRKMGPMTIESKGINVRTDVVIDLGD